jgi:hypothetical protein
MNRYPELPGWAIKELSRIHGTMQQTQTSPKFKTGDRVFYRLKAGHETFEIRCQVLDVMRSDNHGYLYQLSGLNDYFGSDIRPDTNLRLDTVSK